MWCATDVYAYFGANSDGRTHARCTCEMLEPLAIAEMKDVSTVLWDAMPSRQRVRASLWHLTCRFVASGKPNAPWPIFVKTTIALRKAPPHTQSVVCIIRPRRIKWFVVRGHATQRHYGANKRQEKHMHCSSNEHPGLQPDCVLPGAGGPVLNESFSRSVQPKEYSTRCVA